MQPRIGDRFQRIDSGTIWELIQLPDKDHEALAIDLIRGTPPESIGSGLWEWTDKFKYLGNFNKNTNFNSLYDKLTKI